MIRTYREIANTWYFLAFSIDFLFDLRKALDEHSEIHSRNKIRTINLQLILNSAALIEGSISSVIIQHISQGEDYKRANRERNLELRNILDNLIDSLNKSQWRDLSLNALKLLDIDLKRVSDNDWEIIVSHFRFRNLIAHGGVIITGIDLISDAKNISEIDNEQRFDLHNYKSLFNFLVRYNLIDRKNENKLIEWEFLKSEIADFFVTNSINLIRSFYNAYIVKYPDNRFIINDFEKIRKIKIE